MGLLRDNWMTAYNFVVCVFYIGSFPCCAFSICTFIIVRASEVSENTTWHVVARIVEAKLSKLGLLFCVFSYRQVMHIIGKLMKRRFKVINGVSQNIVYLNMFKKKKKKNTPKRTNFWPKWKIEFNFFSSTMTFRSNTFHTFTCIY